MDLTRLLLRHALPRPLPAVLPGGTGARLAVERLVRERGWPVAASPAEANLLVVAGPARAEAEPYLARVRAATPMPSVRVDVELASEAEERLDAAVAALRNGGGPSPPGLAPVGEVPMAGRAEDRDGLMLDRLHVPLGPVLADWPAGLIVRASLQGDVIQEAVVGALGPSSVAGEPASSAPWARPDSTGARRLDSCARLLGVAGWPDAAATARRFRDRLLEGADRAATAEQLAVWTRRVGRSWTLRWMLRGVGPVPARPAPHLAAPPALTGDAWDRLGRWLAEAVEGIEDQGPRPDARQMSRAATDEAAWTLEALPRLLAGTELASARLIVAGLDPDLDALGSGEASHG